MALSGVAAFVSPADAPQSSPTTFIDRVEWSRYDEYTNIQAVAQAPNSTPQQLKFNISLFWPIFTCSPTITQCTFYIFTFSHILSNIQVLQYYHGTRVRIAILVQYHGTE